MISGMCEITTCTALRRFWAQICHNLWLTMQCGSISWSSFNFGCFGQWPFQAHRGYSTHIEPKDFWQMNRRDGDGGDLRGVVTRRLPGTVRPPAIQTPDHSMNAAASNDCLFNLDFRPMTYNGWQLAPYLLSGTSYMEPCDYFES